jgi:hypothetical protein
MSTSQNNLNQNQKNIIYEMIHQKMNVQLNIMNKKEKRKKKMKKYGIVLLISILIIFGFVFIK